MAAGGGQPGGILGLLDLIEEHRGAVEYDWRVRFRLGFNEAVPSEMGWGEVLRLVRLLQADPSSAIAASVAGWDYAISREALLLADLYDLTVAAHTDPKNRPDPHPMRPYKTDRRERRQMGNTGGRTRAEVVAILNAHGHDLSA